MSPRQTLNNVQLSTDPLFSEVADRAYKMALPGMKESAAVAWESIYRIHILPIFGAVSIRTITSFEIEDWVTRMREHVSPHTGRMLSPETVRIAFYRLGHTFAYALRHDLISVNPVVAVVLPRKVLRTDQMFLNAGEVEAIANELDNRPPYGLLVRAAAYTGMRRGELVALRVGDVDLDSRHIQVRRTHQRIKGGWKFGTPKSARGVRDVPIPDSLARQLADFLSQHPYRNDASAALWPGLDPTVRVKKRAAISYDHPLYIMSIVDGYFLPAVAKLHLNGVTWNALRHTYASLASAAGVEIHKVSRWMGHADIVTTDRIYTHLFKGDAAHDMARLDRYLQQQQ
jgi:integrase